jgi:TrmH family RNA methyltransferase
MPEALRPLNWYRKLVQRKERLKAGAFLIEGARAISQVIENHPDEILEILAVEEPPPAYRRYPVRQVTESQFRSISRAKTPQGIAAVIRLPLEIYSAGLPEQVSGKVLLMEDIQDPGNVGTLIRTAAAFDYSGVIMTESCADPFSPKCIQSTAGSVLSLWLRRTDRYLELTGELKKNGYELAAAELGGDAGPEVLRGREKLLLALGNEAAGLSPELLETADYRFRLPTVSSKAESLNVAACGAICIYLSTM